MNCKLLSSSSTLWLQKYQISKLDVECAFCGPVIPSLVPSPLAAMADSHTLAPIDLSRLMVS
jgi:hypothetical protein